MRTLWNVISFLAVVHLLALVMVVAWLWQSGRITKERVQQTRELFALTETEAQVVAAKRAADEQAAAEQRVLDERRANPPADSASQITQISMVRVQEQQSRQRLLDEKAALLEQLAAATLKVNENQSSLAAERVGWETAVQADRQRKTDEQFLQTVKQYEQVPPKQGKRMLIELVNKNEIDQAVAYLDSMNTRAASKIIKEFKTDSEITLATDLLERLRSFGVNAPDDSPARQESANASRLDNTQPAAPASADAAAGQPDRQGADR